MGQLSIALELLSISPCFLLPRHHYVSIKLSESTDVEENKQLTVNAAGL